MGPAWPAPKTNKHTEWPLLAGRYRPRHSSSWGSVAISLSTAQLRVGHKDDSWADLRAEVGREGVDWVGAAGPGARAVQRPPCTEATRESGPREKWASAGPASVGLVPLRSLLPSARGTPAREERSLSPSPVRLLGPAEEAGPPLPP